VPESTGISRHRDPRSARSGPRRRVRALARHARMDFRREHAAGWAAAAGRHSSTRSPRSTPTSASISGGIEPLWQRVRELPERDRAELLGAAPSLDEGTRIDSADVLSMLNTLAIQGSPGPTPRSTPPAAGRALARVAAGKGSTGSDQDGPASGRLGSVSGPADALRRSSRHDEDTGPPRPPGLLFGALASSSTAPAGYAAQIGPLVLLSTTSARQCSVVPACCSLARFVSRDNISRRSTVGGLCR
jgi:hypothetical protein